MIRKNQVLLLVIITAGILILLIGCGSPVGLTEESLLIEETFSPVATTNISGIEAESMENEIVTGDITWKIVNVNDHGSNIVSTDNYTYSAVVGKFIILEFMIKNNSSDSRILYDLMVIDNKGRVYSLCLPAYAYFSSSEKACALVDIIPGVDYTLEAPFDVSPNSEGLVLEVTDLLNPPVNKAYIDLGI
jgi:hypothetical protein